MFIVFILYTYIKYINAFLNFKLISLPIFHNVHASSLGSNSVEFSQSLYTESPFVHSEVLTIAQFASSLQIEVAFAKPRTV